MHSLPMTCVYLWVCVWPCVWLYGSSQGRTALLYALSSGFRHTSQLLVRRGSDVFAYDKEWVRLSHPPPTAVHTLALCSRRLYVYVLSRATTQSWSPVHWAARRGDCVLVRTLCEVGCNAFQRSVVRCRPLCVRCACLVHMARHTCSHT